MINKKYLQLIRSYNRFDINNFIFNKIAERITDSLDLLSIETTQYKSHSRYHTWITFQRWICKDLFLEKQRNYPVLHNSLFLLGLYRKIYIVKGQMNSKTSLAMLDVLRYKLLQLIGYRLQEVHYRPV